MIIKSNQLTMYDQPTVEVVNLNVESIVCTSPGQNEGVLDEELIP